MDFPELPVSDIELRLQKDFVDMTHERPVDVAPDIVVEVLENCTELPPQKDFVDATHERQADVDRSVVFDIVSPALDYVLDIVLQQEDEVEDQLTGVFVVV